MPIFPEARRNMVENQLRPSRILDERVLAAMGSVPRELFVPKVLRGVAYADEDLHLPDGRRLIEPLALARMLQEADTRPSDVVLLVGCDNGYAAAVVAHLAATVILAQPDPAAAERVQSALDSRQIANAVVSVATDPLVGLDEQAPFDVILVLGSVPERPDALCHQLGELGRLVAVLDRGRLGKMTIWTRIGDTFGQREIADTNISPLPRPHSAPRFVF